MSSAGATTPTAPDASEIDASEGILIAAAILGLLIFCVILRFGCNILIDFFILDRGRLWAQAFRKKFSRRGSEIETEDENAPDDRDVEMHNTEAHTPDRGPVDIQVVLGQILPRRTLTEQDVALLMKQSNGAVNSSDTTVAESMLEEASECPVLGCSICLQDLSAGQSVHEVSQCSHLFHADCIRSWVGQVGRVSHRYCPNCRTEMVSSTDWERLAQALEGEHHSSLQWQQT
jgi:hypothetical protein